MRPGSGCSTIMPPDTAGMLRSDQADPDGATAMMSPGFNAANAGPPLPRTGIVALPRGRSPRSEEHTSELQSLMRISYADFCLKKETPQYHHYPTTQICRHIH